MGEFFNGWRRKTGVVATLMACVVTAAWVRRDTVTDQLRIPAGTRTHLYLCLGSKGVTCFYVHEFGALHLYLPPKWYSLMKSKSDYSLGFFSQPQVVDWVKTGFGFFCGQSHDDYIRKGIVVVPFWSIGLPLTLLSAFLLLSKPRVANA